jgi:hypothetical protein
MRRSPHKRFRQMRLGRKLLMKIEISNPRVGIPFALLVAAGLLTGCSTPMVNLKAVKDPASDLSRESRIAVLVNPEGSIDDKQFAGLLMQQMRVDGFNLVTAPQSVTAGGGPSEPGKSVYFQDRSIIDRQSILAQMRNNMRGSRFSYSDSEFIDLYNERALALRGRLLNNADFVLVFTTEVSSTPYTVNVPYDTSTTTFGSVGDVPYYAETPSTTWVPTTYTYFMKSIFLHVYSVAALRSDSNASEVWLGSVIGAESEFEKSPTDFLNTLLLRFGQDFQGNAPLVHAKRNPAP